METIKKHRGRPRKAKEELKALYPDYITAPDGRKWIRRGEEYIRIA